MNESKQPTGAFRAFVSSALMFSFLAMAFTGILFFLAVSQGGFLRLDKEAWEVMHINSSALVLLFALLHILLNWRLFWRYVGFNWPLVAAAVLVVAVIAGTALKAPLFDELGELHEHLEHQQASHAPDKL